MRGRKPNPAKLRVVGGKGDQPGAALAAGLPCEAPDCPAIVADHELAAEVWHRFLPELLKAGFMARLYEGTFAMWCVAYGRWAEAEADLRKTGMLIKSPKGYPIQNPYLAIANRAMEQMHRLGEQFGMSPIAVARAQRAAQGDLFGGDRFAEFWNRGEHRTGA